jgi:hypothetical protein
MIAIGALVTKGEKRTPQDSALGRKVTRGPFTTDLVFDRLMGALEKRAPLFEDVYLREIIHEASIVTRVHVRGARLRAICHIRAPCAGRQLQPNACISQCNKAGNGMRGGSNSCSSWCLQTMQERKAAKQCK